jgi:hypothetical protein
LTALIRAKIEPLAKPAGADDARDHAQRMADALQTYLSEGSTAWDPILVIELKRSIWRPRTGSEAASTQPGQSPSGSPDQRDESGADDVDSTGAESVAPSAQDHPEGRPKEPGPAWQLRPPGLGWPFDGTAFTARLPDGTPIPVRTARRILLTAGFSALVLGTDGQPLYLGRKVRFATPHQRRAINARYRTCVVAGCDIPAGLCELDHADGWVNGDVTDVDKLAPICGFHNTFKFENPDRIRIIVGDCGRYRYELNRPSAGYGPRRSHYDRRPRRNPTDRPPERGP